MANPLTIFFAFERETKGAVRFQEVDGDENPLEIGSGAKVGTLYVRKSALPIGTIPERITMSLSFTEEL